MWNIQLLEVPANEIGAAIAKSVFNFYVGFDVSAYVSEKNSYC